MQLSLFWILILTLILNLTRWPGCCETSSSSVGDGRTSASRRLSTAARCTPASRPSRRAHAAAPSTGPCRRRRRRRCCTRCATPVRGRYTRCGLTTVPFGHARAACGGGCCSSPGWCRISARYGGSLSSRCSIGRTSTSCATSSLGCDARNSSPSASAPPATRALCRLRADSPRPVAARRRGCRSSHRGAASSGRCRLRSAGAPLRCCLPHRRRGNASRHPSRGQGTVARKRGAPARWTRASVAAC